MLSSTNLALAIAIFACCLVHGLEAKTKFHDGKIQDFDDHQDKMKAKELLANYRRVHFSQTSPLERRVDDNGDDCASTYKYFYEINGDGDPHQNYKITQIANSLAACPISISQFSHTVGWSYSTAYTGPGKFEFANLGFNVSESVTDTVAASFDCLPDTSEICAMHYAAFTALSVTFYEGTISCGTVVSKTSLGVGTVWLPNTNGIGSAMARGTNFGDRNIIQCRGQAERTVDFICGPKGGPEWFDTNDAGPWTDNYMSQLDPPGCAVPIEALHFVNQ